MKNLQILMPMAGLGSRFADAEFDKPKPLIEVDGLPMFRKALESVANISANKSFYFVIRQEHIDTQGLDELIIGALPEAKVIVIPKMTRGAVETALAAENSLNAEDGLIIMDCDLWFKSSSYNKMVEDSLSGKSSISGGLLTFQSDNPRYSYARFGDDNIVIETAEKRVISRNAITGAYFFANSKEFLDSGKELMERQIDKKMPEYYLSLLYNILINEGKKIQAAFVDEFASFGTPQELEDYQKAKQD